MHIRISIAALLAVVATSLASADPARAEFGLAAPPRATFHEPLDITWPESVGIERLFGEEDFASPVPGAMFLPLEETTQAGAHPDLSIDLDFNKKENEAGRFDNDGSLKSIDVELPPGFNGIPANYPQCDPSVLGRPPENENDGIACEFGSQVGIVVIQTSDDQIPIPVYSLKAARNEPAKLGFTLFGVPVVIELEVRTESDHGITAKIRGVPQAGQQALRMTLWGDPSDATHDGLRADRRSALPANRDFDSPDYGLGERLPSGLPSRPFLTAPARCDAPLSVRFRMRSWEQPDEVLEAAAPVAQRTGCDRVPFAPSLTATPGGSQAGQPVGMRIDLGVPQSDRPDEVATGQLRDASVTLPAGVAISPGGADGLAACSDDQLAVGSRAAEACPQASKVGSTTIDTPLLDEPLLGDVYLGQQLSQDPASGDMYRLFVTAYARGVRIKLKGNVVADPATGRLTATFRQNPELPFSTLRLDLKDGPRALLTNPTACGTGSTRLDATSYSGATASSETPYVVDQNCPTGAFGPSFVGGTVDPFAGRLSPFTTTITRPDGQADLSSLSLDLPPGLLGALSSVPVCAEAQAAAGTCDAASRIGSTSVAVGTGSAPFSLPGTVALAGPYKGQPFSLSIAVPAKAGPLDLGLVVVRAPLVVNAARAQVSAPVDALPQIVGGVPLHYRTIGVSLDRPGFMFNATNCTASEVVATLTSTSGVVSRQATRYQPDGCDRLRLRPALKLAYSGSLKKDANPKLTADLSQVQGEANLERVAVTLPTISSLAPENAETLCSVAQFTARDCPAGSIVGRASATTPALPTPLTGPIHLVQGQRVTASGRVVRTLPKLWLKLEGSGIPLDLVADTGVDGQQRLVTTFTKVPDAPISAFRLEIDGGRRGILTAVEDPCQPTRRAGAVFDGQNGARVSRTVQITAPGCAIRVATKAGKRGVRATVSNIAPGTLTLRGSGLRRATRTVRSGDSASLTARLTKRASRALRRGRTVRPRLRVTFDPKAAGKTRTVTRRVTIRP